MVYKISKKDIQIAALLSETSVARQIKTNVRSIQALEKLNAYINDEVEDGEDAEEAEEAFEELLWILTRDPN